MFHRSHRLWGLAKGNLAGLLCMNCARNGRREQRNSLKFVISCGFIAEFLHK